MPAEQTAMSNPATTVERRPGLFGLIAEDLDCVFQRDPAARSKLEVLLTYPGLHAVAWQRVAHRLWLGNWCFAARLLGFAVRMFTQIDIHPGATIGRRFFIDHGCGVVIGETAEIGDDVTLYHGVTLGGTSWTQGKRHPTLRDGVIVGAGAKILGPIEIGKNVMVGANSVVINPVPDGMTVVGIPGRTVLPLERRRITEHGIDLDHHLIPDPMGKALACMLQRIDELERQLGNQSAAADGKANCSQCGGLDNNGRAATCNTGERA